MVPPLSAVLFAQTNGETDRKSNRITGSAMDARCRQTIGSNSRLEVVLRLVVHLVSQVVDVEIQIQPWPEGLRYRQIQHIESRSSDCGILSDQPIVPDMPVPERTVE